MRWPRLNSLTGLNWSRFVRHKEEDPAEQKKHESLIRGRLESIGTFSAGKIGTSELMVLEYFDRRIRLPWPESASWLRPAKRLFENSGFFPSEKICLRIGDSFMWSLCRHLMWLLLGSHWYLFIRLRGSRFISLFAQCQESFLIGSSPSPSSGTVAFSALQTSLARHQPF